MIFYFLKYLNCIYFLKNHLFKLIVSFLCSFIIIFFYLLFLQKLNYIINEKYIIHYKYFKLNTYVWNF
ncbi:hypothetical protein CWS_00485 [Buchnera aphidicola str. JF99 (Acyrthosiphon pisum)]|nr:hypothetical protein CWO_00470 [Buchnera aphidicola str. LL01 (Acyrthosiphon pisum)]ADP66494.1 hypothetical protein CWQ_00500 [Buchnera aphidicola str. TLW03 (Acyrthosiphon pisum)]ADP67074.1 hypothetical protein CWS_00485 [Buchnera aphidicola str. JF99 (Acyrthosiphon pisum)]ADP67646.1 hypothetical protein CWU_00605 [Buchnera aphidicola str. JF98 (Acyrthosiphon pisum)]